MNSFFLNMDENTYRTIIQNLRDELFNWSINNTRDFSWRKTQDSYKIIIAEIMLHRTKADQVKEVYEEFIEKYPDFNSIIRENSGKIQTELHSLGLFWRSDLLYRLAKEVVEKYDGILPLEKNKLLELPGIGNYIASAVLCFGNNIPEPLLDTNTVRVIGRIFGINITDSSRRSKKFHNIMRDLVTCDDPKRISLSLIDFAAAVCTAKYPRHDTCPVNSICSLYRNEVKRCDGTPNFSRAAGYNK